MAIWYVVGKQEFLKKVSKQTNKQIKQSFKTHTRSDEPVVDSRNAMHI